MSTLVQRMTDAIDAIRLVDTHEHLLVRRGAKPGGARLRVPLPPLRVERSGVLGYAAGSPRGRARRGPAGAGGTHGADRLDPQAATVRRTDQGGPLAGRALERAGAILGPDQAYRLRDLPAHRHPRPLRRAGPERTDVRAAFRRHRSVSPRRLVPARPEGESRHRREHPGRLSDGRGQGAVRAGGANWSISRAPPRAAISGISSPTPAVPSTPWTTWCRPCTPPSTATWRRGRSASRSGSPIAAPSASTRPRAAMPSGCSPGSSAIWGRGRPGTRLARCRTTCSTRSSGRPSSATCRSRSTPASKRETATSWRTRTRCS